LEGLGGFFVGGGVIIFLQSFRRYLLQEKLVHIEPEKKWEEKETVNAITVHVGF
jgi:hypothetical protein